MLHTADAVDVLQMLLLLWFWGAGARVAQGRFAKNGQGRKINCRVKMQGLRDEAKFAIASAMDEGKYAKSVEERQVEIENWERDAWVTHGECYCRRYVEAINKR